MRLGRRFMVRRGRRSRPLRWLLTVHRDERGMAIASVALLGAFLILVSLVTAARGLRQTNFTQTDARWEEGFFVAESGLDYALVALDQDSTYNTGESVAALGSRDDIITVALAKPVADLVTTPEGDFVVLKPSDDDVIYAVGFTPSRSDPNHKVRVVRAEYMITLVTLPDGAASAKGDITFSGEASTQTVPSSEHTASVYTNGDFTGGGDVSIDGGVEAAGTVDPGGASIYDPAYPNGQSGVDPIEFPTSLAIELWRDSLIADAQAGGTQGTINLNGGTTTLNSPVYLDGDISLGGGATLTITGGGVVYVTGSVELSGSSSLTNDGILAIAGTFSQSGDTSYTAVGDPKDVALVSFAVDPEAIVLVGQAAGTTSGFAYAAYGGVKLSGSGVFGGALVAGGDATNGGITVSGSAVIEYPAGLITDTEVFSRLLVTEWSEL
ncbi:MAG: hypothetical protein ACE5KX_03175 [Acidimicrobiia bacterium]